MMIEVFHGVTFILYEFLMCCHILTDKGNGRRTDRKNAKKVYPVVKVVSVAMKVLAEGVRVLTHQKPSRFFMSVNGKT